MSITASQLAEQAFLSDNPFRIVPEIHPTIWAGREEIKGKIEHIIINSIVTSPTCFIVCWGEWGTGKTHAARFFSHAPNVQALMKKAGLSVTMPLCLVVTLPKPPKAGITLFEFYRSILDKLTFSTICESVTEAYSAIVDFHMGSGLPKKEASQKAEKTFLDAFGENEDFMRLFTKLGTTRDPSVRRSVEKYLKDDRLSASESEELDMYRSLQEIDYRTIISGILRLVTFRDAKIGKPSPKFSEVFLWIDEGENLIDMAAKDVLSITAYIRDLLDCVPDNLTVMLNVSLTGAEWGDIEGLLGDPLVGKTGRITDRIQFDPFSTKDAAMTFVEQLINSEEYRSPALKKKLPEGNVFYPFCSKIVLEKIFDKTTVKTPRRINDNCSKMLELAIFHGYLKEKGCIDEEFVEKNLKPI